MANQTEVITGAPFSSIILTHVPVFQHPSYPDFMSSMTETNPLMSRRPHDENRHFPLFIVY
jgi:hypothetical protein